MGCDRFRLYKETLPDRKSLFSLKIWRKHCNYILASALRDLIKNLIETQIITGYLSCFHDHVLSFLEQHYLDGMNKIHGTEPNTDRGSRASSVETKTQTCREGDIFRGAPKPRKYLELEKLPEV